ncbi:MAG: hypothetical protein ACRDND_24205 [Streptosporangiaceae bacterium]
MIAAARREAEAAAEAGRIAGACLAGMRDLAAAAFDNLRRIDRMGPGRAAQAGVLGAVGIPCPPREGDDDADA